MDYKPGDKVSFLYPGADREGRRRWRRLAGVIRDIDAHTAIDGATRFATVAVPPNPNSLGCLRGCFETYAVSVSTALLYPKVREGMFWRGRRYGFITHK